MNIVTPLEFQRARDFVNFHASRWFFHNDNGMYGTVKKEIKWAGLSGRQERM